MTAWPENPRILILTPIGRDANLIGGMLSRSQLACDVCSSVEELALKIRKEAETAVLAEEALVGQSLKTLTDALDAQPPWSDFPLLFLTMTGRELTQTSTELLAMLEPRANVTILERPIRMTTLMSTVRSALRARRRQYEVRDYLEERKRGQEKLLQTQKLESLGVLAGGVAHDFNNLLVGILGNAALALDAIDENSPAQSMLRDVISASEAAANLTKQLLAYAGKGRFVIEPVNLSDLIRQTSTLVQASIPRNVQLRLNLVHAIPHVEGDSTQLQQLIMNLVINAAEAIGPEQPGTVIVSTGTERIDASHPLVAASDGSVTGDYVGLEVQDDGQGMSEETLSKIFDPFFTTKFTGRGLGLAAAQGIVRSHRGGMRVTSTPGKGTTFKVVFPASDAIPAATSPSVSAAKRETHRTVLVIDDEKLVRVTAKAMLEGQGYTVVMAENGREGVDLYRALCDRVDLVLLDMTMPVMSGVEAFRELRAVRPDLKVILSSGYSEAQVAQSFEGKGLAGFLQKPYSKVALVDKIASALRNG